MQYYTGMHLYRVRLATCPVDHAARADECCLIPIVTISIFSQWLIQGATGSHSPRTVDNSFCFTHVVPYTNHEWIEWFTVKLTKHLESIFEAKKLMLLGDFVPADTYTQIQYVFCKIKSLSFQSFYIDSFMNMNMLCNQFFKLNFWFQILQEDHSGT